MNFKENESAQKLKGSYYTPKWIADFVARWIAKYDIHTILEPSCGDGVFFQSVSEYIKNRTTVVGFDTDALAIAQCKQRSLGMQVRLTLRCEDFLQWSVDNMKSACPLQFDAVVGNPPFIRYQYLEKDLQSTAQSLFELMGQRFTKHTNAWLPFVLASIAFLKPGGHIGMVIPSEILNVLYAQGLREYLLASCRKILLIDPEDIWFENTLQGAMLLMAEKKENEQDPCEIGIKRTVGSRFAEGDPRALFENADYLPGSFLSHKWSYALLTKREADALHHVRASSVVYPFNDLADVDVGIVTGANRYFLVNNETVERYNLFDVVHPMFGRSEHCRGIVYDMDQHLQNAAKGFPSNFIYFDTEEKAMAHQDYLAIGEAEGIPLRYKCRIRKPWYRVPSVYSSKVNMLKRSNGMPRLILNKMQAYNTDTAYRITPGHDVNPEILVYCFINSITALSAELEGRFYGGGVLELVPSEIERLLVVYEKEINPNIDKLNADIKTQSKDDLLHQQDAFLFLNSKEIDYKEVLLLHEALIRLQARRQRLESPSL